MSNITIVLGNVCDPIGEGKKVIAHICNDIGVMGSGVAGALRRKWEMVGKEYEDWCNRKFDFGHLPVLGQIQFVRVAHNISVCNMIGQRGVGGETIDGEFVPPIKYESLRECLLRLRLALKKSPGISLHIPMIGSKLAGGNWYTIYAIIRDVFDPTDIHITIYAFDDANFELAQNADKQFVGIC
jgi:O-acetyl-ADP-ribose deacetylase (regulator of RNase III)